MKDTQQDSKERAREMFEAVESRFDHLKAKWCGDDPESMIDLEIAFDVQPGLIFSVGANLQGEQLCLWVGDSLSCEWFPCSDREEADEFQACFEGVLSGRLRLIEFARNGRTFKAQLQDHSGGRWQTIAKWSKLSWPSLRKPVLSVLRNRPPPEHTRPGLDEGLIADIRDVETLDSDAFVQACEAIHREARHEDLPLLRSLLADPSALVREAVAWPIADLEGPQALRDLLIAYQRGLDDGLDNDGFTALLIDLVTRDTKQGANRLRSLTGDASPEIRENALWLLTHCEYGESTARESGARS